jgi:hypothetical protein
VTLRRTEIGPFAVEEADPEVVIASDAALARLEDPAGSHGAPETVG